MCRQWSVAIFVDLLQRPLEIASGNEGTYTIRIAGLMVWEILLTNVPAGKLAIHFFSKMSKM